MTKKELNGIIKLIDDCDAYLEGRKHSNWIADIANAASRQAVLERKESLFDRLRFAGLNLIEDEV